MRWLTLISLLASLAPLGGCAMTYKENSNLYLQKVMRGGVIVNASDLAVHLAKVYISNLYGEDELTRQLPLSARDEGDIWVIEGSFNSGAQNEGTGPVRITLGKADGRLIDAVLPYLMHTSKPSSKEW